MRLITEFNERGLRARFLLLITAMLAAALWVAEASATAVVIGDTVYFSRDSSALSPEGQESLARQAQWLKENPSVMIMIEGHTDDWGNRVRNFSLGQRRAEEVRRSLTGLGIAAPRISVISYGEDRPAARCRKEQCWSYNRRAVTTVTSGFKTE